MRTLRAPAISATARVVLAARRWQCACAPARWAPTLCDLNPQWTSLPTGNSCAIEPPPASSPRSPARKFSVARNQELPLVVPGENPAIGAYMGGRLALYGAGGRGPRHRLGGCEKTCWTTCPNPKALPLLPIPEDAIATMIRPPAKRGGRRVPFGGGGREKVVRPSALGMLLPADRHCRGHRAFASMPSFSLGTTFYRSYYRHLDHTAGGTRRQERVRHLLRRQEPAAGCGRSRHQGCGRLLAQGGREQVGGRRVRQRHDPDARRGASADQAGGG